MPTAPANVGQPSPKSGHGQSKFTKAVCAMAAACVSYCFAGCATGPAVNGIPNFSEVRTGLYRGGQPNEQGWQFLRSIGVTNIVKLNREVADAPAEGMMVQFIPLPPATISEAFRKPRSNDVCQAVQAMKLGGTFVHCRHGRDRTGLVVGCYRMWIEGWSDSAAAREMGKRGYRWSIPGLAAFWRSVSPIGKQAENKRDHPSQPPTDRSTTEKR